MLFESMRRRCLRDFGGSYPDPIKTDIMNPDELVTYTTTLQSVTSQKYADIDISAQCFVAPSSDEEGLQIANRYTRPFADALAAQKNLEHFSLHVVHASILPEGHDQQDHDQQQPLSALTEPTVLAPFAVLFKFKNLETLTLVGLRSVLENPTSSISLPNLKRLFLAGVSVNSETSADILTNIIKNGQLKSLAVVNAYQTNGRLASVIADCAKAKDLKHLQMLNLSHNNMCRESMNKVLKGVLSFCSNIDQLILKGNTGPDKSAIPRTPSSTLTVLEMSNANFEFVEHLIKAASVAGSLPILRSIVVHNVTPEGPMVQGSFDRFSAALGEKSRLETLILFSESSFWLLAEYALDFNPSKMGPQELFWNDAVPWIQTLGEGLKQNSTSGSLTKFYLAGVSDFERFHPYNPIAIRIPELSPRIIDLAPTTEELTLMLA
ncbi:hypothetical protein BGZ68_007024 [Mortierella alpina]|nr:hypothetical protein BGZ68_007024 [Mortierella alpina]